MSTRTTRHSLRLESLETRVTPSLTPVGPEFRVNTYTTLYQRFPGMAFDSTGVCTIAWHGADAEAFPTTGYGITTQRYSPDGVPLGPPIAVSETSALSDFVRVEVAANDNFIVAWDRLGDWSSPSDTSNVYVRRYDSSGNPLGNSQQINDAVGIDQLE